MALRAARAELAANRGYLGGVGYAPIHTLTIGSLDSWLSKPFAWMIKMWCRATGHAPNGLLFIATVAADLAAMTLTFYEKAYLFSFLYLLFGIWVIRRGQRNGSLFSDEVLSPAAYAYLRVSRIFRFVFIGEALLNISAGAVWWTAVFLLLALAQYAATTTGRGSGKKISERIRSALAARPRLVPIPVPAKG